MPNASVEFVRQYAKENNLSYGCAISEASPAYRKMKQEAKLPKTPTKKRITIKKKETNEQQIRNAEYELQDILHNTEAIYLITSIKPKLTGTKGMNPAHKRDILSYKTQYNKIKINLEEMTNNKYPEFPEWEKFNKEAKKVSSKFQKEEKEKDRLKMEEKRERKEYNLRHGIEEEKPYEFPKKKKKTISEILF